MSYFSVLLSVYHKETSIFLDAALNSIEKQTLAVKEIVLVKDGPLPSELDRIIMKHSQNSKIPYVIVALESNVGLGEALNRGLVQCTYEWIARMDTDDIALPDRFEKQFSYLEAHPETDILGGWICEFDSDEERCDKKRRVPSFHDEIVCFAKHRNPLNHMTVVFRKDAVLNAGGYRPMNGFEDYYLWMRMIQGGKHFANLPEVLVKARTGREMVMRRQGWEYAKDEWCFEKAAYRMGFWSKKDLVRNMVTRVIPRLLPLFIVEKLYNVLRKF